MQKLIFPLVFFTCLNIQVFAQSTFEHIQNVLITNCSNSGCHGSANPMANLNFTLSESDVYAQLVGAEPINPHAKAKGDHLIFPGYPEKSFLLRKISHGLSQNLKLETDEGAYMPNYMSSLPKHEIETVRQWILRGAPENGDVVDRNILEDFYTNGGLEINHIPDPPDPSEGYQIHVGPIFLYPLEEFEFMKKQHLFNDEKTEVNRIGVFMNWQSHHYIIYKFINNNSAQQQMEGVRPVTSLGSLGTGKDFVTAWQFSDDSRLPETTAFFWKENTYLDLNYHIKNYDTEKILKAEVYMNVYTQPSGTAEQEMHAALIHYNYSKPSNQFFLLGSETKTFTDEFYQPNSNDSLFIWMLSSHTHKFGTDYNIYERNPDGSKGQQLYDGYYNTAYEFIQGYYDYEHPPVRYFNPLQSIALKNGLIHEATFHNTSNDFVSFGLTTDDEMMLFMIQYTLERPLFSSVNYKEPEVQREYFQLLNNPVNHELNILSNGEIISPVNVHIMNTLGQVMYRTELNPAQTISIPLSEAVFTTGKYFIRLSSGDKFQTIPFIRL